MARDVSFHDPDPRDATINTLADLLDGVMQDDPQAIRDAAAWLVQWDARENPLAAPYGDADTEPAPQCPHTAERPTTARKDNHA